MKKIKLFLVMAVALTFQTLFAQVPSYVPTNGLVGYWPFNGNANNTSGSNNNGIINGATLVADRFGNPNSAFSFNGVNNYIELNSLSGLSSTAGISMSTWFLWNGLNGTTNHQYIFQIAPNPNGAITISDDGTLGISVLNCNCINDIPVTTSIIQNTWYHVVLTYDLLNGTMKMYLNGNLIGTSQESMYNYYTVNNTPSRFGNYHFNSHFFKGSIDDSILWNRVLTQQEITNLYNVNQCITNITVTDTLIINVGQLSFNDPVSWANNITIAPNPASSQININFNNITNLNGGTLKIINSLGQQVATTPITTSGTNSTMQLATWGGTGMYFVQIINPQGQIVDIKKIILQ